MASVAAPSCWEAAVQFLKCPTSTHTHTHSYTLGLGTVCTPRHRAACRCQCQHIKSCQISVISRQSNMPQTHTHRERDRYWCPAVEEMRKRERGGREAKESQNNRHTESSRASRLTLTDSWQFGQGPQLSARLGSAGAGLLLVGLPWHLYSVPLMAASLSTGSFELQLLSFLLLLLS